ncbi:hypothetical protein VKT23_009411 [Stygiomarasmius scandens]|uniref:FAD-binding PCMH-type domain-containing protein n=1 Tax=Marasmiellus scandens TaxID=2682957 RepID=A0ABR1JKM8_9AGAR
MKSRILLLLINLASLKADQTPFSKNTADPGHLCCNKLFESLPSKVHLPGSVEYERQQYDYYSLQQAELQPSCRVTPTTSSDVSLIMKTVTTNLCPFAVRSGGHSAWPGSNVQGGVTLDLSQLTIIDIDEKRGTVGLGPGSRWKAVYAAMEQYNLTVVGGRSPNVGVGGFMLGGGISLLSFRRGFGCDNIVNYEIVLADGTILDVNATSHSDLFWALKLGSTNYGIVTRSTTREELQVIIIGGGDEIVSVWHASLDSVPGASLTDTPTIADSTRTTSLLNLVGDLQSSAFVETGRRRTYTLTVKLDAPFLWDVFKHAKDIFDKLEYVSGMHWYLIYQPITKGFPIKSSETGGSPFKVFWKSPMTT